MKQQKKSYEYFKPYGKFTGSSNGKISVNSDDAWCRDSSKTLLTVNVNNENINAIVCSSTFASNSPKMIIPGSSSFKEYGVDFQGSFSQAINSEVVKSGKFTSDFAHQLYYKSSAGLMVISSCNFQSENQNIRCTISNIGSIGIKDAYVATDHNGDGTDDILAKSGNNAELFINNSPDNNSISFGNMQSIQLPSTWMNDFNKIQKANFAQTNKNDLYLQSSRTHLIMINDNGSYKSPSADTDGKLDLMPQGNQWNGDCWNVGAGDIDGNGYTDFVTASYGEVSIMFGDKYKIGDSPLEEHYKADTYPFAMKVPCMLGKGNGTFSVLDVNRDSKADIICSKENQATNLFISKMMLVDSQRYSVKVEFKAFAYEDATVINHESSLRFKGSKINNNGLTPITGDMSVDSKFQTETSINLNSNLLQGNKHKVRDVNVEIETTLQTSGDLNSNVKHKFKKDFTFTDLTSATSLLKFVKSNFYQDSNTQTVQVDTTKCALATHSFVLSSFINKPFTVTAKVKLYDNWNDSPLVGDQLLQELKGMFGNQASIDSLNSEQGTVTISGTVKLPGAIDSNFEVSHNCNQQAIMLSGQDNVNNNDFPILGDF